MPRTDMERAEDAALGIGTADDAQHLAAAKKWAHRMKPAVRPARTLDDAYRAGLEIAAEEAKDCVEQRGTTVAAARAFARRAAVVFVHYASGGRPHRTECLTLSRGVFLRSISAKADTDLMRSVLYPGPPNAPGEMWLRIGGAAAE